MMSPSPKLPLATHPNVSYDILGHPKFATACPPGFPARARPTKTPEKCGIDILFH